MSLNLQDTEPTPLPSPADDEQPPARRGDGASLSTRRTFLRAATAAAGLGVAGGAAYGIDRLTAGPGPTESRLPALASGASGPTWRFRSRPDLRPPALAVAGRPPGPGYLLLGPGSTADRTQQGPMIVGPSGEPVWFAPLEHGQWATNLQLAALGGHPALAWWQGKVVGPGFGVGEGIVVDSAYRRLARVRPGNGRQMDLHEFRLTPQGTALFTCTPQIVSADLSAVGGPTDGKVQESVFQEVDLMTGRLLMEWRSLDHIPLTESYKPVSEPWDYVHLNSIDVLPDGNLLVSGRHTWTLYKLDRRTGAVMWRLGGKRSDFRMGTGSRFFWQHDARMPYSSVITVFDNSSDGPQTMTKQSRALLLDVDEARHRVRLVHSYQHPDRSLLATAMGSVQVLPSGHALVGWGTASYISEFTADGSIVGDARLPSNLYSYRAARAAWSARPAERPAIAVHRHSARGPVTLYASWNGATDVAHWRVRTGRRERALTAVGTAPRQGFETAITVPHASRWVAVTALDSAGRALGHSRPIRAERLR